MPSSVPRDVVEVLLRSYPQPSAAIRAMRIARGWSQRELGRRCGYSASQVSRWETGRLPLRDVELLRAIARALGLPPSVFGLAVDDTSGRGSPSAEAVGPKVGPVMTLLAEEDDPVRRRTFLQLAGLAGTSLAWSTAPNAHAAALDPARVLAKKLGDVLLNPTASAEPVTTDVLRLALTTARREFAGCQYLPLADRLPALLTAAEATATTRPEPDTQKLLAESYNLATRALIKLETSGLEWLAADRGQHAARSADDPLTLAESQRLIASVARRAGHHDRAQALTLAAADHLDVTGNLPAPGHLTMASTLYCSAGYAAARAGDRDRADELLGEAAAATDRLIDDPERQRAAQANLVSHRVSAAYLLGDAGAALAHAHSLPLAAIPTTERRARLMVDMAMAYVQWDKPEHAYRTLLAAERTAPGEVRTRNAVRRLVISLMTAPKQAAMPGLPALAKRVHAA